MNFIKMEEIYFNEAEYKKKEKLLISLKTKIEDLFNNAKESLKLENFNFAQAYDEGTIIKQFEAEHADKLNAFLNAEKFINSNTDINLNSFQSSLEAIKKVEKQNRLTKYFKITKTKVSFLMEDLKKDLTLYLNEDKRKEYEALKNILQSFKDAENAGIQISTANTWRISNFFFVPDVMNPYGRINPYDFKA